MKVEKLKKKELVEYCEELGIETKSVLKPNLIKAIYTHERAEIDAAIALGNDSELLKSKIIKLADEYEKYLKINIENRKQEMQSDDNSHYLIYKILGIPADEGKLIDEYQNTGRFLYNNVGSFLEEAASLCLFFKYPTGERKKRIDNTQGQKPKKFEIDFLNGNDAIEFKWRDATTDGDHIIKEHTRVQVISREYTPIRVMFYYPQREQAIKIQETLKTLYQGVNGEYYAGDEAWAYLQSVSGYDLKSILTEIAESRKNESAND